jgi:hypothetical protein
MQMTSDKADVTTRAWPMLGLLALILPGPSWAAPPTGADPANTVSELVVTAAKTVAELTVTGKVDCLAPDRQPSRGRPKVVSTFPAKDAVVRPGLLVIRVTFDQPMACEGFLDGAPPVPNPCPEAKQQMLLSYDRRTVRTVCVVDPDRRYAVWVSHDPVTHSFMGLDGLPSEGHRLNFSAGNGARVTDVCDALLEDEETARQIREHRNLDCATAPPAPAPAG